VEAEWRRCDGGIVTVRLYLWRLASGGEAGDFEVTVENVTELRAIVDSQQPLTLIRTMDELIDHDVADRTRPMILLGVFAGLALVLACLGVYGVLAFAVAQRTREIGVRMALGARPLDVTSMILGSGLKLSGAGLLAGAALATVLSLLLRSLLYGVTPVAPAVYVCAAGSLVLVAAAACIIPAQRAARVDPILALRDE
jgi:putative ABC transport system permease protein